METILETQGLTKFYGKKAVVREVSLRVPRGSIFGLLGPNGAGKSTTLKLLTGLARPSSGRITLFGESWKREHLRRIGALIETPALYGNLTAPENLTIHLKLAALPQSEAGRVLKVVGLRDTDNKLVAQFSTGMKQRLGLAIALLGQPELLILDEPTNGLDPLGIAEFRRLLQSFRDAGVTVVLSSHILPEVAQIADVLAIISDGELSYQGPCDHSLNLEELFLNVVKERRS